MTTATGSSSQCAGRCCVLRGGIPGLDFQTGTDIRGALTACGHLHWALSPRHLTWFSGSSRRGERESAGHVGSPRRGERPSAPRHTGAGVLGPIPAETPFRLRAGGAGLGGRSLGEQEATSEVPAPAPTPDAARPRLALLPPPGRGSRNPPGRGEGAGGRAGPRGCGWLYGDRGASVRLSSRPPAQPWPRWPLRHGCCCCCCCCRRLRVVSLWGWGSPSPPGTGAATSTLPLHRAPAAPSPECPPPPLPSPNDPRQSAASQD